MSLSHGPRLRTRYLLAVTLTAGLLGLGVLADSRRHHTESALEAHVRALLPEVSDIRGLPWIHPVPIRTITRCELANLLTPRGNTETTIAGVLRHLRRNLSGYYDTSSKAVYVVSDSGYCEDEGLVHELAHALDDQHFDLEGLRMRLHQRDPSDFIYRCVAEGSAELVRVAFLRRHGQAASIVAARGVHEYGAVEPDPRVRTLVAAYDFGLRVVTAAAAHGSNGVNGLFINPPSSQSVILHPGSGDSPHFALRGNGDALAAQGVTCRSPIGEFDFATWMAAQGVAYGPSPSAPGANVGAAADGLCAAWELRAPQVTNAPHTVVLLARFRSVADASEAAQTLALLLARGSDQASLPRMTGGLGTKCCTIRGLRGDSRVSEVGADVRMVLGAPAGTIESVWAAAADLTIMALDD